MSIDAWSAAVARLVTIPVRHDPNCAFAFTKEARDDGWLEVHSPLDFGFGPGMPSRPDLQWGVFAVHPKVRRVALELHLVATNISACRVGLWEDEYPVLVILRAPMIGAPNSDTDWASIADWAQSVARMADGGCDPLGLSHVTKFLDSASPSVSEVGLPG